MIRIQQEDFFIQEEMAQLRRGIHRVGGLVSFVGTVRDLAQDHHADDAVVALNLEHYPGMTEGQLEKIETQALARFNLEKLLVVHRVGRLALDENIVLVIAAAAHRAAAFDGCRYVIDYLKILAPFWKKEILASGEERWIHTCPGCVAAATQWKDLSMGQPHSHGHPCSQDKVSGMKPPSVGKIPDNHKDKGDDWAGLTVGILTLSDSRDLASDRSGDGLEAAVNTLGALKIVRRVLRDDREDIAALLRDWSDVARMDVILTTGGTGPGPRDVTPEATRMVTQRELPGFSEIMRREGLNQVRSAVLTRGITAFRGHTLIINLPGSTRGALHSLGVVADLVPHALAMAKGGGHG
ncbi:MAG: molybdenum cofactor biosynthesis protein MoaE [Magnetococcales bacterium]|nr:molybdenum cofactor biosynthesis protein MoaE [Magnetococcales bacterium]